jgi:hypothetical protein
MEPVAHPEIENPNDIAVRDLARQQQFLLESAQNIRVAGQFRPDDFESHRAVELPIERFEDRAHAAFAEQLQDFVAVRDYAAGTQRRPATLAPQGHNHGPAFTYDLGLVF